MPLAAVDGEELKELDQWMLDASRTFEHSSSMFVQDKEKGQAGKARLTWWTSAIKERKKELVVARGSKLVGVRVRGGGTPKSTHGTDVGHSR